MNWEQDQAEEQMRVWEERGRGCCGVRIGGGGGGGGGLEEMGCV